MKNFVTTEFKVGITIIIATLVLIFGIIWGKGFRLHTNKYRIEIAFDQVGGLVAGDPVTVNGVKEGKVLKVSWDNRRVLCTAELNNTVQLYEDATFTVISAELLAGMKIEIFPGKSDRHINFSSQPFKGAYGGRIVDVGLIIGDLAKEVSALTVRIDSTVGMVNQMLGSGKLQGQIEGSLANFNTMSGQLRSVPADLKRSLANMDSTVRQLNGLLKNNNKAVGATIANLNTITTHLDTATIALKNVLVQIDHKKGFLGKMVNDSTLYNNLNRTLSRIDSLTRQIKEEGFHLDFF